MGHDHSHGHSHGAGHAHSHGATRAGARHQGRLAAAFAVLAVFMVVELTVGLVTGSLALLSDAGHMVTDVAGLGMALAAIRLADRHAAGSAAAHPGRTFGLYRLEILAALANAVLLFGVAGYVLVEAVQRFGDAPDIDSGPVLVAAGLGLVANLVAFALLREGSKESLNVEGAYLEVLADTVGSVGVIVGALVMRSTGWAWIDPAVGVAIGLWVVPRTWRLAGQAVRILIQAAPQDLDLEALAGDLAAVDGVVDVHDLHVWTLTSDMDVASAHLMIGVDQDAHAVLDGARSVLRERYGIAHATLQVEPEDHQGCNDVTW
jgi:cobalt-zinc-cadmium efflux system protein